MVTIAKAKQQAMKLIQAQPIISGTSLTFARLKLAFFRKIVAQRL